MMISDKRAQSVKWHKLRQKIRRSLTKYLNKQKPPREGEKKKATKKGYKNEIFRIISSVYI